MFGHKGIRDYSVAAKGGTALSCPRCSHQLSLQDEDDVYTNRFLCQCGYVANDVAKLNVSVLPSSERFMKDRNVRSASWYHMTMRSNWREGILDAGSDGDTVMVHLGTLESAMRRALDVTYGDYVASDHDAWTLHEVKLNRRVEVAPKLGQDEVNGFPRTAREAKSNEVYSAVGVTRYLNLYEIAGSVSLLANARSFEVVSSRTVSIDEVFEFAQLS